MEHQSHGVAAVSPPPLDTAPDPSVTAEGMRAVEVVLQATEAEVARIAAEAREEVRRFAEEADAATAREAGARREELAKVRAELLDRATLLAQGFEEVFDLLEAAEAELAAGGAPGVAGPPTAAGQPQAARVVLRERMRVTVAHDAEPAPRAPEAPAAVQAPRRRRRWWRLWRRRAA